MVAEAKNVRSRALDPQVLLVDRNGAVTGLRSLLMANGYSVLVPGPSASSRADDLFSRRGLDFLDVIVVTCSLSPDHTAAIVRGTQATPLPPRVVLAPGPELTPLKERELAQLLNAKLGGHFEVLQRPVAPAEVVAAVRRSEFAFRSYAQAHGFSRREAMVMRWAIEGVTDDVIASVHGCSRSTVKTYWARLGRKTGSLGRERALAHVARWFLNGVERSMT